MLQLLLKRGSRIDVQDKVRVLLCHCISFSVQLAEDKQFRQSCIGNEKIWAVEPLLCLPQQKDKSESLTMSFITSEYPPISITLLAEGI